MSLKIKISYDQDDEKMAVMNLLKPILKGAKIRKNEVPKPYKRIYLDIKKVE